MQQPCNMSTTSRYHAYKVRCQFNHASAKGTALVVEVEEAEVAVVVEVEEVEKEEAEGEKKKELTIVQVEPTNLEFPVLLAQGT